MRAFAACVISLTAILLEASAEKKKSGRFRTRGIYKSSSSSARLRRRNQDATTLGFDPYIGVAESIPASQSLGFMSPSLSLGLTIPALPSPAPTSLIDVIDVASSAPSSTPSSAPLSAPSAAPSAAPSSAPSASPIKDTSGEPDDDQKTQFLSMSMPVTTLPLPLPCIVCANGLLVAPDTQISPESAETCQDVLDFSTSVAGGSEICAEITEAEVVCCPEPCPFCPLGITSEEDLEISNGLTCKFTQDYSQEIASNSPDCEVIQFAEVLCCPEQQENACHFCQGSGVSNQKKNAVIPDSGDTTCGRAELFALGLSGSSEECDAIQSTEPICCPRCSFCPEGLEVSADTLLPGGEGVTCGMASEYAPTIPEDDGNCSMTKLAEALCCPMFALEPSIEEQHNMPTSMSLSVEVDYSPVNPEAEETLAPVQSPILLTSPPATPNETSSATVAPVEPPIPSGIMSPPTAPPLYSSNSPTSAPAPTVPTVPSPPSSSRHLLSYRKALIVAIIAVFIW
mmetsp:Transcript_17801/g.40847  ORF Transcript_17801/g.40847 Transcript_17801/m.40847 type:complete len:512 (-) Transcript_17801:128-1663(-)